MTIAVLAGVALRSLQVGRPPGAMATRTGQERGLEVSLGVALKTWARKSLLMLYQDRFPKHHPNHTPHSVLMKKSAAKFRLNQNKAQAKAIEKDEVEKFDISALYLLLRYACGFSNGPSRWNDMKTLEGNIEKLKDLRNLEAHWTEEVYAKENLEEKWKELLDAVMFILKSGGFEKWIPIFKINLQSIKEGETYHEDRELLQKSLQGELRKLYKSGRKTTLMPLVWAGRSFHFTHDALHAYISTKFSITQDRIETFVETNDLLEKRGTSQIIVVQGESGTGKTSLLRYYASLWKREQPCPVSTLSNFDYLVLLDCNAVSGKVSTTGDIIREIFPVTTSSTEISSVVDVLSRATDSVMFLIDSFDERLDVFRNTFKDLQKKFPKALFLVTTRPHLTHAISTLCEDIPLVVTAHGFNWSSAEDCVSKILASEKRSESADVLLKILSPHQELVKIPQLLCWCTWLWMENGNTLFSTRGKIFSSITDFMLRKLCYISDVRIFAGELPKQGQRWLSVVAQCAYDQAKIGLSSLSNSSKEITALKKEATDLKLRPLEALSSLMQSDSFMSARGEHVSFQFIHNSHAQFLIAHHVCECLENDKATIRNLIKDLKMDKRAILAFVVSILFKNTEKPIGKHRIQEIASLSKQHVKFYDINFYLDLIEESQYNERLVKELARNLPVADAEPSAQLGLSGERIPNSHLWLRKKEIDRSEALSMLLTFSTPSRLWLRLSNGKLAAGDGCGTEIAQCDVEAALKLIRNSYGDKKLCELKLSDFTASCPLPWPQNLWWLSISCCNIEDDLGLQEGLLKLSMCECTSFGHVKIPSTVKYLNLQEIVVQDPVLPSGLETLVLKSCQIIKLPTLPASLKKRNFENCIFWENTEFELSLMSELSLMHEPSFSEGATSLDYYD
ncbi:NLR family CARD domain-containing protein 4-like isoform X2 [Penaeus japonicus]|uniref:NLR family CARD domain-containing protein 4-like isoform X2 n=1 Tax=Penaeus japonicus TaxID=27405 RepID=UPI001C70DF62|nr:NLR family CARD domain-containing protein 4-like isoform X2 [Penaeus japonicus]